MKHISIREYAERNGISYATAYRMIRSGKLPEAVKMTREVWRVPVNDTEVLQVKGS
jgi:excisionase family DNA binding protein